jgi:hypothetical protein
VRKPKQAEQIKGVYEHPAESGIWWIHYYADGKRHREKARRKSDAGALHQKRKADARRKLKLPELMPGKVVTFGQLSTMAVDIIVNPCHPRRRWWVDTPPRAGCCEVAAGHRDGNLLKAGG